MRGRHQPTGRGAERGVLGRAKLPVILDLREGVIVFDERVHTRLVANIHDLDPPEWTRPIAKCVGGKPTVGPEIVMLELYRLVSLVLADEPLAALIDKEQFRPGQPIVLLRDFAADEWTRLLVSTAIMLRSHHEAANDPPSFECGRLAYENQEAKPLSLREACNKVIHANRLAWRVVEGWESEDTYVVPIADLEGDRDQKRWRASLDLRKYVVAGVELVHWDRRSHRPGNVG